MKRGFTLIELLIVIGILAILATAVVLVLNPAQLLAQARDSQRISDLASVRNAISLFLASAPSPVLTAGAFTTASTVCGFTLLCTVRNIYTVDGAGWVGVNLTLTSGGSPLSTLPRDPINNATYQYGYAASVAASTFELNGRLESIRHRTLMETDGGNQNICATFTEASCWYEVGTAPGLNL